VSASRLAAESVLGAAAAPSACRPPLPPPLPTVGLLANGAQVWAPRCICFLSSRHEPLAFKVILHALASLGRLSDTHGAPPLSLPIETALMHIVQSVPLPVSGGPVVRFTIHPDLTRKALSNGNPELSPSTPSYGSTPATQKSSFSDPRGANTPGAAAPTCGLALHLSAPLPTELPRCDYAASLLLARLKPPAILKLLTLLLLEWQLVVVSDDAEIRVGACELLLSWLHPFGWAQAYVPTIPDGPWLNLLKAPFPFIIGLTSSQLDAVPSPRPPRLAILNLARSSVAEDLTHNGQAIGPLAPPSRAELVGPSRRLPALPLRESVPLTTAMNFLSRDIGDEAYQRAAAAQAINMATGAAATSPHNRYSAAASVRSSLAGRSFDSHSSTLADSSRNATRASPSLPPASIDDRARDAFLTFFASLLRDADRLVARHVPHSSVGLKEQGEGLGGSATGGAHRRSPLASCAEGDLAAQPGLDRLDHTSGSDASDVDIDVQRDAFVAMHPAQARPFVSELARTQMFAQLLAAAEGTATPSQSASQGKASGRLGSIAFQRHLDNFLARRVAALTSIDKRHVAASPELSEAAHAAIEAQAEAGAHTAACRPMTLSTPVHSKRLSSANDSTPAAVAVYEVPPPMAADPLPGHGFRYPDHLPSSFPHELRPLPVPLPLFEGELPPPPPQVAEETRRAWAEALADLERRADRRQVEQKVGAGMGAGAVVGGALAATALGCVVQ